MIIDHADDVQLTRGFPPRGPRLGLTARKLAAAVPVLLLSLVWGIHFEATLPSIRVPGPERAASAGILAPGEHPIVDAPVELVGNWYIQPLGDVTSVVTDQPGAVARLRVHGTQVLLTARVGPESSRAYITVDGQPVPDLERDGHGSFVRLRASKAADRDIVIASGLAHGEHDLTITNGSQGQLAISAVIVEAQTPFPWAFALFYGGVLLLLVVALRGLAWEAVHRLGWAPAPRTEPEPGGRR